MPSPKNLDRFETLIRVIAQLRAPDGCPWDRKQTHASLKEYLLEESYEVLAALDAGDSDKLYDELGDLLLQIVLHAQIASEDGEFDIADVIRSINTKLIRRHPHIFGTASAKDAEEVVHNWEALKKEERPEGASMLDSIPIQMPALSYSKKVQERVARVGFDWKDASGIIDKLAEEVREFQEAPDRDQKAKEFGDILFTLVNFARRQGIDAESALRDTNRRFFRRFVHMEELCRRRGLNFDKLSFKEQNALWEEAKRGVQE